MSHPTNRGIIDCLRDHSLSFTDLMNKVGNSDHGRFGYHLRMLREFVELESITKEYRLTDKGKLLSAVIRDFRFLTSGVNEASRYAKNLRIGDHAVALYDNEDFERRISFPFLKAGLSRGEATVYVVSEDKLDSEVRELQKYGIDFDGLPMGTFTVISAYEWFLRKGKAKAKTIAANWQTLVQEKKKAGFLGVHAAAEMAFSIDNSKSKELLRFEQSLGRKLASDVCGLCLYDKNILEEGFLTRVLNCHGHVISKDLIGKTVA